MNGTNLKEAIDTGGEEGIRSEIVLMSSYIYWLKMNDKDKIQ